MSHIVLMAMKKQWTSLILVLVLAHAAKLQMGSQGLSCVNDFVNTVNCTWNSSAVAPGVDCWIEGIKEIFVKRDVTRPIHRSCKLKQQEASPPGCSLIFENTEFDYFEKLPSISVKCNGSLLEVLTQYQPCKHVKMNPPEVPNVSSNANETRIIWRLGSPQSDYIKNFDFELQIKLKKQTWKEAKTLPKSEQYHRITAKHRKQYNQARVRVRPSKHCKGVWSDWSPTASWKEPPSENEEWSPDHTLLVLRAVILSVLLFVIMLVFYMCCLCKWHPVVKPLPNPSKYFPTLHSIHGGNLKKWLNPLSTSESFFTALPHDHISPVEVCESWDMVPSTSLSTSSTSAHLHFRSFPSAGSITSGVIENSSSSSCFSNMGYFMSEASSSLAGPDPSPAYFSYQDDVHNLHNNHNLSLSLCPSFIASRAYESLKREPQSPDSGFGIGQEDEGDKRDEMDIGVEETSEGHQSSPLLILPLHLSSWVCPPPSVPAAPHPPSLIQICSDIQEVDDEPEAAACESYAAWPVAGSMCRSSSMPVEPCKTGYLTLKELQTTFSNKSI